MSRLRLLSVDDSADEIALLHHELRRAGLAFDATHVSTPETLRAALAAPWDVVLSDWSMPGFDGLAAFRIVREVDRDVPFIIVSGTIDDEIAIAALQAGVHDFVSKDKLARLAPAIERELREAEGRRRQRAADTELASQRELLARSEAGYRSMFESSPLPMWTFEPDSLRFVAVNDAAVRYYGYSRDEFRALHLADIWPNADPAAGREAASFAHAAVWRHRTKDGAVRTVKLSASDVVADGRRLRLMLVHDVTAGERRVRPPLGLWVALGLFFAIAVLMAASTQHLVGTIDRIEHTHHVIEDLGRLEADLGRRDVTATLASVRREVDSDLDPDLVTQGRRLDELERIAAMSAGDRTRAQDELRGVAGAMTDVERTLLAAERADTSRQVLYERIAEVTGTALGVVLLLVAFIRLSRETRGRQVAEAASRRGEESLATTLQSIADGVIATDAQGCVVRMNRVAQELTRWTIAAAAGRPFAEVCPIHTTGARGPTLVARDGTETPITTSTAPIRDPAGAESGAVVVLHDASAERAWERQLAEANTFLDSIVENIPDMVFVKDAAELRFVRLNRAGEQLLGADRAELIGKTDGDRFPAALARAYVATDRETLASGSVVDIPEEPIDTPQGRRWLHTKKIPIRDATGAARFLLGISEDITERKQIADRLRTLNEGLEQRVAERTAALHKSEEQLRQAQKLEAIGRLAGGIAHDFNNLLSVIISYSEMLVSDADEGGLPEAAIADIQEIHKAGHRAADLTRQLLAFSRQQVLVPRIVDLNAAIAGLEKMLRRVIGADIELRTRPHAGGVRAKVDPGQIEQVIMNLVVNARDAMPRGGTLTIETAPVELDATYAAQHPGVVPGRYSMLAVTDSGAGMTREVQARVFDPFFTTKDRGQGTGLGLATVHGIVQQSGGSIWLYSEPGHGTTFKIYLPETRDAAEAAAEPAALALTRGSETILLVEDEPEVRAVARGILARVGYQVIEAGDGVAALAACASFAGAIDLVLSDVVMPRMSGRELVERLVVARPGIKVLFMSGYTDDTIVHHGVLDREVAFVQKPLTPDVLQRKVREVLTAPRS